MNRNQTNNSLLLGRLVKEYKKSSAQVAMIIALALISAGVAAVFFSAWFTDESLFHKIGLSIPGLLFLLPPLAGVYVLIRGRGASLKLYENGLSFRRGGKESSTTWDEIDSYLQETACRITKKDGEVIEFGTGIKAADEVAQKIIDETLKRMLPRVKSAIAAGSRVEFKGWKPAEKIPLGKALDNFARAFSGFTVDATGITTIDEGNRIAWKDVTDYGITEETMGMGAGKTPIDVLYIADKNQTFRTRLGLLNNGHVLLALCEEMAGDKGACDSHE